MRLQYQQNPTNINELHEMFKEFLTIYLNIRYNHNSVKCDHLDFVIPSCTTQVLRFLNFHISCFQCHVVVLSVLEVKLVLNITFTTMIECNSPKGFVTLKTLSCLFYLNWYQEVIKICLPPFVWCSTLTWCSFRACITTYKIPSLHVPSRKKILNRGIIIRQ